MLTLLMFKVRICCWRVWKVGLSVWKSPGILHRTWLRGSTATISVSVCSLNCLDIRNEAKETLN
jgi:hypothetical protein